MANTKIEFVVHATKGLDLYLCGNVTALGEWDAAKAVKLSYCADCNSYTVSKMLPADETIEFKVLSAKDWNAVEKGFNHEDVANHSFVAVKGTKVEVSANF